MRFIATHQNLLAFSMRTRCARENRSTRFRLRARQGFLALFLAMVPVVAWAQIGREFDSVEACVGTARVVHVGRIVEIKPIEYGKPLTDSQKMGKPHRLVFAVSETIRGEEVRSLELVLSLQRTHFLEYMRDQSIEVMLVGGPARPGDSYSDAEIGIEEQGKRLDDEGYQFRLLDSVKVPESGGEDSIAAQINQSYDCWRMFTNELEIVVGREAILKRARAFARLYPDILTTVSLRVPNEFGVLCGDPNAYSMITLPICPETKTTLAALKDDPGLILRRIKSENEDWNLALVLVGAHKALAVFPDGNAILGAARSRPTSQTPDLPGAWVDSDNGDLSLRLRVKSARLAPADSIFVIAEIRNNRTGPVTILRPFGDHYESVAGGIKIWNEHAMVKYTGGIPDYDLNKTAFTTLEAMETATETLELHVIDFAETSKTGSYAVRYDHSYHGGWDEVVAKQGVSGIWQGAICSREVRLTKQDGIAPALRPSREQLAADLRELLPLAETLNEKPDDPAARQDAAALAIRLAPDLPRNRVVAEVLIKSRTLKDGMSLAEAEELLGPPSRKSDKSAGWDLNPDSEHVAPYLHAGVRKGGLAEWTIFNR